MTISLVGHNPLYSDLIVRRGPLSTSPPSVLSVERKSIDGAAIFEASAQAGEEGIADGDLLYFWKLSTVGALTTSTNFRAGARIELPEADLPTELWLLVSDQRGGEVWEQVLP